MARTLERRILAGEQEGLDHNPLGSGYRAGLADVTRFLEGSVDDERIEDLLFAFTLVDWKKGASPAPSARGDVGVWPVYALLKHLFLAEQVETGGEQRHLMGDLGILSALKANDVETAARAASRRLQNAGMVKADIQDAGGFEGMRLAAALLIPAPFGPVMRRFFETRTGEQE